MKPVPDENADLSITLTKFGLSDAVRHHILLRALRGQRHDVLGPLSAARMVIASLKRRLAGDSPDVAGALQQIETVGQQVADAVSAVALMRVWDGGAAPNRPLDPLVQTCADLLRTDASLRGHQITLQVFDPSMSEVQVRMPDAQYALLGWLVHHVDACGQPSRFTLFRQSEALAVRIEAMEAVSASLMPPAEASAPNLGADELAVLLLDLGWEQRPVGPGLWHLAWPAI